MLLVPSMLPAPGDSGMGTWTARALSRRLGHAIMQSAECTRADDAVRDAVRNAVRTIAAPAVAVSVVSRGEVVFQYAHGEASGVPCDPDRTMFPTASISKTVVATLAAQCAERDGGFCEALRRHTQ